MAYNSYNEYIVLNNCGLILGLIVLNYISFTCNIKPLTYILTANIIQALECMLSLVCLYNIWGVAKVFVLPYLENVKIPFGQNLFVPGEATSALWNVLRYFIVEVLLGREPSKTVKPSTTATDEKPKSKQLFLDFLESNNAPNASTTNTGAFNFNTFTTPTHINDNMIPTTKEVNRAAALNHFSEKNATTSKLAAYANPNDPIIGTTPKLRFTSVIKPPLAPSTDRVRTLWYLNRTPEVVDDFRIEQILAFRKYWNKFNERVSSTYYDKMTKELYERIFKPLAKSIDHFTTILATKKKTIAKCPPATIGLSLVLPGFNKDSDFSISEVVNFISLETHSDDEEKQYVLDRIVELARSKKLAGYRYTPKTAGMPTDSEIIIHVLKVYLIIKEPYAIPPLVPADTDLFKFLLIYFYMTPELDHWRIFE